MRIKRLDLIKDDPAKVVELLEKGTLGNKLGLLRAMGDGNVMREVVSKSILEEMLSRHRNRPPRTSLDDWLFQSIRI